MIPARNLKNEGSKAKKKVNDKEYDRKREDFENQGFLAPINVGQRLRESGPSEEEEAMEDENRFANYRRKQDTAKGERNTCKLTGEKQTYIRWKGGTRSNSGKR